LPQKQPKQVFPYIEEHKSDLDQDIFSKNVPPPKITEKQVNPSHQLFVDLSFSTIISKKAIATPKVTTRRSLRIARTPLGLVGFACVTIINKPLKCKKLSKKKTPTNRKKLLMKNIEDS